MGLSSPVADPGFFGKDDFVPFIGQVVNVNDPKLSNRVKVRCIGWHPKDVKDLPNDDLPWARVGMPTTHAMIGRTGGKHGLLPGSWVMGFFLDGHKVQEPFILTTINATSNATEEPNTKKPTGTEGQLDDSDGAFTKETGPQAIDNKSMRMLDEQETKLPKSEADKSGDLPTHNALGPCDDGEKKHQSVQDFQNTEEETSPTNKTSMLYDINDGDSKCGASAHSGERIQIILKEMFPNDDVRFAFNDVVYSATTGDQIQLNALMNLVATLICDILKDSIEVLRGLVNDTILRPLRSATVMGATYREYSITKLADQGIKAAVDMSNKVFTLMLDTLCMLIRDLLNAIAGTGPGPDEDGDGSNLDSLGVDPVGNIGAQCVTDAILENITAIIGGLVATEIGVVITAAAGGGAAIEDIIGDLEDGDFSGVVDGLFDLLGGLGIDPEFIESAGDILSFITEFKFTLNPILFATIGPLVLDLFNQDACGGGVFRTWAGALGEIPNGSTLADFFPQAGLGGLPAGSTTGTFSSLLCDEALGVKIPGVDFPSSKCRVDAVTVSVPSSNPEAAQNYISGIPNGVLIKDPGCDLFFGRGDQILFDIGGLFPAD